MIPEAFFTLFQLAVLGAVFLAALRLLSSAKGAPRVIFFCFAAACYLFSDFYWLVYGLLRPDIRMPFAANEICEWAFFLLMGASLNGKRPVSQVSARWEMLGAALFTAASTALWIAWSGEWVQDILTGLSYGWFFCCLAAHLKRDEVFTPKLWRLAGIVCFVLIAAQVSIFFVPETVKKPMDLFCYVLLFAWLAFLLVKAVLALKRGAAVSTAFAALAWATTTMYMSAGAFYSAAVVLCTLTLPLSLLALRKEAAA